MPVVIRLKTILIQYLVHVNGRALLLILATYLVLSWAVLRLCGENQITDPDLFLYWVLVTASTVGYGDYSPVSSAGRWFTALFVIPMGLGLFAFTVGKVASAATQFWRQGIQGLKDYSNSQGHILVIGWNGPRTVQLLQLLLQEELMQHSSREVLLCSREEHDNPLPDKIKFVRTSSYTDEQGLVRAGVGNASCIIIDTPEDDVTLTSALYCYQQNNRAHLLAYFQDEHLSQLLVHHCPTVECAPSVSVEMLAKAAADPGSSALHHDLLNVQGGMTQFSLGYPQQEPHSLTMEQVFQAFKANYDATLIGVANPGQKMALNPPLDYSISPGARLFYIAAQRIRVDNWHVLTP